MRNRFILLAALNFIWSISALIFDWHEIIRLPIYILPFFIICPIYPMLLAIYWSMKAAARQPNQYLIAFATLPSFVFFIASLIYYPAWMMLNRFDWLALGQIFWIAFYGTQAAFILKKELMGLGPLYVASVFIAISQYFLYSYRSLGFFDFSGFSSSGTLTFFLLLATIGFAAPLAAIAPSFSSISPASKKK